MVINSKTVIVTVLLLIGFVSCLDISQASKHKPEIIDSNHFFSQDNKEKTYNISKVDQERPLSFMIRKIESDAKYENKISVEIKSGSQTTQCNFSSFDDLCVVDKLTATSMSMTIKCSKLPCDVEWDIFQSEKGDLSDTTKISQLYKIENTTRHMILAFSCNKDDVTDFPSLISLHSNLNFYRFGRQSNAFFIFDDVKQGFVYVSVDDKAKSCIQMKVKNVPKELGNDLISDFAKDSKPSVYDITDIPSNDFRIDTSFKSVPMMNSKNENKVTISITGVKNGGNRQTIRTNEITFGKVAFYEFSYVIPKIDKSIWSKVQLQILSANPIMSDIQKSKSQVQQVEGTEYSYFDLKKGEKLKYKLVEEKQAEEADEVNIYSSDKDKIKINETSCKLKPGCLFDVEALDDVRGRIYLGDNNKGVRQVVILDFGSENKFTKKIREGQNIYIKKKFNKKAYQVLINTPNVMVYASKTEKCSMVSEECYEKFGNVHNPFFYEPEKEDIQVMFMIKGLDNCEFTLTLIEEGTQYIELKDSEPFAYAFDKQEKQLKFTFKNSKKEDVTFNLISPVNKLNLYVSNSKKSPDGDEGDVASSQGFLEFSKKEIKGQDFSILVKRINDVEEQFIHFTLIASTQQTSLRLQPGITHYETLNKKSASDYVFEFNSKDDYVLNFYTHNVKEEDVNILLLVSGTQAWDNEKGQTFTIDKQADVLLLNDIAGQVCIKKGESTENCELFIQIKNQMDMQIDITITLMTKHSVIELKDGLWQTFALNSVASSSHFYFFPQHKDKDVTIIYKNSDTDLRIIYRVYNSLLSHINPAQWPFPDQKSSDDQAKHSFFKPVKTVGISKSQLKECWPSCVVLASILSFSHKEIQGNFSIMATNNVLQIPAKEKVDITVNQSQQKSFLVDIKYAIEKSENIIFYLYHSIGLANVYVNVYSEKNQRIPEAEEADFQLSDVQTTIKIDDINNIIEEQEMEDHLNVYLYMVVEGFVHSKLSIEYDYQQDEDSDLVKMLDYDTYETVKLDARQVKYFHVRTDQDYEIKLVRTKGFPFVNVDICKKKDLHKCLQDFQEDDEKGKQILSKTQVFKESPCQKCIGLAKIQAIEDPAEVEIHVQSKYSQIQLTQGKIVSDFTENDEANRYALYAIKGEQIVVNIHVTQGQVSAELTDLSHINMKKTGKDVITIVVPAEHYKNQYNQYKDKKDKFHKALQEDQAKQITEEMKKQKINQMKELSEFIHSGNGPNDVLVSSFGLMHKFTILHLTIKSANTKVGSSYTLSYSSGDRQVDLQDGLIVDYNLQTDKQTVFYYSTATAGHAYLTVSMDSSSDLSKLDVKMEYCEDAAKAKTDSDCWTEFTPEKPPMKKKTPNPTIMYSLPAQKEFAFTFMHKGSKEAKISIGVNHQQVILLPYNHEFPFVLHKTEDNNILVDVNNPGYLLITLRKCDESEPTFGYTFDYDQFQKSEFTYETTLQDDPKYQFNTKVTKPGTLYMHISSPNDRSLLSVKVEYYEKKTKGDSMKAGNKGLIKYSIIDSQKVELTINSPLCEGSHCSKKVKYTVMTANKLQDLYTQLVCPSNFFSSYDSVSIPEITQEEVAPKENSDGTLSFEFKLLDQISYVGIKATTGSSEEIYYKPIEVATLWGQLARTSHGHKLAICSGVLCFLMGIVICVRRNARQGYKRIDDDNY